MRPSVITMVPLSSNRVDEQKSHVKQLVDPIISELEKYEIPEGKEEAVIDFTLNFFARNQHMKTGRIVRKIADEFKLTLKST